MGTLKRLLSVLVLAITFSCTTENIETTNELNLDRTTDISLYDNSNLGIYKGVFSTLDNEERGIIEVTLIDGDLAVAQLVLDSGETIQLVSSSMVGNQVMTENIQFNSNPRVTSTEVSFEFSVGADGTNPSISNVQFNASESSVLIVKETSRTPINPITGTYNCINCAELNPNWASGERTFNMIFTGDAQGNQAIATQAIFSGMTFISANVLNSQSNCNNTTGGNAICDIEGTTEVIDRILEWNGTHQYSIAYARFCSYVGGLWEMETSYGMIYGRFSGGDPSCL